MCHDLSVPGFCCPSRKLWKQNSLRSAWSEWPVKNQVRHTLHSLPSPTVVLQQRPSRWSVALPFLFLFFNIYLFIWLHWVLVRACSIFMALYGIFSLWPTDSLVVGPRLIVTAHGLSCSMACGILVSPTGEQTHIPCIAKWNLNHWVTREVPPALSLC